MPVVFQKYHFQIEQEIASRYYIFFILNWRLFNVRFGRFCSIWTDAYYPSCIHKAFYLSCKYDGNEHN